MLELLELGHVAGELAVDHGFVAGEELELVFEG